MDFGKSASKAPIQEHNYITGSKENDLPVFVPRLEDLDVRCPGIQEKPHETLTPEVCISAPDNNNQQTIPEVDIDEGDAVNIDVHIDNDDDLEGHRGEYLSDDEYESNVPEAADLQQHVKQYGICNRPSKLVNPANQKAIGFVFVLSDLPKVYNGSIYLIINFLCLFLVHVLEL